MAGFATATKGYLPGLQVQSADIGANVVVAADIATNGVGNAELSAGCVAAAEIQSDAVTTAKIISNAVTAAKLNSDCIGRAAMSAAAIQAAAISNATITNAKLSSPESIMHIRFRDNNLSNSRILANTNYSIIDRAELPLAATLYRATAWASNAAGASSCRVRIANVSGTELVTGSGIVVSAAATFRSGGISTAVAAQGALSVIVAKVWTSTTFSLVGPLYVDTWWKVPLTT